MLHKPSVSGKKYGDRGERSQNKKEIIKKISKHTLTSAGCFKNSVTQYTTEGCCFIGVFGKLLIIFLKVR